MTDLSPVTGPCAGPCIVCGATNYGLSCGGPTICPKCDCGNFDAATVEQQAKIIAQLREDLASKDRAWDTAMRRLDAAEAKLGPAQRPSGNAGALDPVTYSEEWRRQIINAGADENVAQQAVALAALNGLFDVLIGQPAPASNAQQPIRDMLTKEIAMLNDYLSEHCNGDSLSQKHAHTYASGRVAEASLILEKIGAVTSTDDLRREAISTIALLLSAFEQVEHEAIWFQKAFEKGKAFLDKWGAVTSTNPATTKVCPHGNPISNWCPYCAEPVTLQDKATP
jgi:hypothetical protein